MKFAARKRMLYHNSLWLRIFRSNSAWLPSSSEFFSALERRNLVSLRKVSGWQRVSLPFQKFRGREMINQYKKGQVFLKLATRLSTAATKEVTVRHLLPLSWAKIAAAAHQCHRHNYLLSVVFRSVGNTDCSSTCSGIHSYCNSAVATGEGEKHLC